MEPPGVSDANDAAASVGTAAFMEFKTRINGCANSYALRQLAPQITASAKKLSETEVKWLGKLYDDRSKELSATQTSLRVISGNFASIERSVQDGDLPKPALWDKIFNRSDYAELLKTEGLAGQLRAGNCRSVAWKVYLGVLPVAKSDWGSAIAMSRREYSDAVNKFILDPHAIVTDDDDLEKNNPLAIADDAPWQKHFQDEEYRREIQQDINRTFPDVDFFRLEEVQNQLLNILFCYARLHPDLGYRQGMHELLAGVYYTVYLDRANPADSQTAQFTDLMLNVLDPDYVAHDSFALFSTIMKVASNWFAQSSGETNNRKTATSFSEDTNLLFRDSRNNDEASSAILQQLKKIHTKILKNYDSELYKRFETLDIPSQIYGLRWIRVLFAREFSFENTFKIWDAIFADGASLDLTDYIFVAMLCFNRTKYLSSEHTTCLRMLMSPLEDVSDVQLIIEMALHIREPRIFPKPSMMDLGDFPKIDTPAKARKGLSGWISSDRLPKQTAPSSSPASTSNRSSRASSPVRPTPGPRTSSPPGPSAQIHPRMHASESSIAQNSVLQRANGQLKAKVDVLSKANKAYGDKLQLHLEQLQEELLVQDRLPNDDVIYLALAGMKKVKDVLQGRISPSAILQEHTN